jgi:hypothetical protein
MTGYFRTWCSAVYFRYCTIHIQKLENKNGQTPHPPRLPSHTTSLLPRTQEYAWVRGGVGVQNSGEDGWTLPFLFWRVSIGRRRSPPSGAAEVSQGDP